MFEYGHMVVLVVALLAALVLTFFVTPIFIKIAFARQILDQPTSLKNHKSPTPYLGGLAVYFSFITILALFFPVNWNLSLFIIGATLLLLIGLIDDLLPMSPAHKLLGQVVAALCFIKGGLFLKQEFIEYFSFSLMPQFLFLVSFFWILTVINALNLVDIMDGLATTVALGALAGFLVFSLFYNLYSVSLVLAICIGVMLGFLYFNKTPAKIYLGDAGSLFIGGILATIPFLIPWGTYTLYGFFTPVIILGVPLIEVAGLIIIRTYKRIPFYNGSPDHFAHYLLKKGWAKNNILFFITFINCLLATVAFLFNTGFINLIATLFLLLALLVAWCATIYGKNTLFFANNK